MSLLRAFLVFLFVGNSASSLVSICLRPRLDGGARPPVLVALVMVVKV